LVLPLADCWDWSLWDRDVSGDADAPADVRGDADGDADARVDGDARPDGDADAGADADADGDAEVRHDGDADGDADTDADGDAEADAPPATEFCDPVSGLCWQDPPPDRGYTWEEADAYCRELSHAGHGVGEWHLPNIDDLRSLVRGCSSVETGGECGVTDPECLGDGCARGCGPCACYGPGGCCWPEALHGDCWEWAYYSSSMYSVVPGHAWSLIFSEAFITSMDTTSVRAVRCVRRVP
jgi:hypothetical protein